MWDQVSGRRGRRLRGRPRGRWRPLMAAPLVGALVMVGGCSSSGGGDADVEDLAAASSVDPDASVEVPVTTEDGRMLQPAGHVGIWFETEPSDPLDRLVWKSQQFVGQPLELEPLGDAAWSSAGAELPDLCDSEVFARVETLGMKRGDQSDFGPEFKVCSAFGVGVNASIRDIGLVWGAATAADPFLGEDGVPTRDDSGIDVLDQGGYSDLVGCVAFRSVKSDGVTLFAYSDKEIPTVECDEAIAEYQIIQNSIGGYLV